jgi:hypothetical protein
VSLPRSNEPIASTLAVSHGMGTRSLRSAFGSGRFAWHAFMTRLSTSAGSGLPLVVDPAAAKPSRAKRPGSQFARATMRTLERCHSSHEDAATPAYACLPTGRRE